MLLHHLLGLDWISSRAKKAAAFRRISFSCSSRLTRFRSSLSSSRSFEVSPSSRSRRSSWSCLSQLRKHDSAIPSSLAISAIGRSPFLASATAPSRNSLGYGLGMNTILPEAPGGTSDQMSTKAGEVQTMTASQGRRSAFSVRLRADLAASGGVRLAMLVQRSAPPRRQRMRSMCRKGSSRPGRTRCGPMPRVG